MRVVDVDQRSTEWHRLRAGVATASNFGKLLTSTGKLSSQAESYADQLAAEWLMGTTISQDQSAWMQRGIELEQEARDYYQFTKDVDVEEVGFILRDDEFVGCSPDGLVGDDGLVEIKCPAPHTHINYLISGTLPGQYQPQVQGQLYVTGRQWCDFISYHPDLPAMLVRVERDDNYIATLAGALDGLVSKVDYRIEKLREQGYV